jgi:hypothetical protein
MNRTEELQSFIDHLAKEIFSIDNNQLIIKDLDEDGRIEISYKCISCGSKLTFYNDFRDELSRKEFAISRLCQKCQDSVFGE